MTSLIEILHRLPTAKSATQCKLVSKRWHSLISSLYFATRFTKHHHYKPKPFALVLNYKNFNPRLRVCEQEFHIAARDQVFKSSPGFGLKFLPCFNPNSSVCIIALYNDLLLCEQERSISELETCLEYYICNPLTKHWVALPPCPDKYKYKRVLVGLVHKHQLEDNKLDSVRVVRIPQDESSCSSFIVEIFSSESKQWVESVVLHPYNFCFKSFYNLQNAFGYNGILYWLTLDNCIVAYDPYKPQKCCFINAPVPTNFELLSNCSLGMCQGSLRLLQYVCNTLPLHWVVKIWKLDDCYNGKWNLKDELFLDLMTWETGLNYQDWFYFGGLQILALDQNDELMGYLAYKKCVLSCNFKTQELKVEDKALYLHPLFHCPSDVLLLVLPPWPTTVPPLS